MSAQSFVKFLIDQRCGDTGIAPGKTCTKSPRSKLVRTGKGVNNKRPANASQQVQERRLKEWQDGLNLPQNSSSAKVVLALMGRNKHKRKAAISLLSKETDSKGMKKLQAKIARALAVKPNQLEAALKKWIHQTKIKNVREDNGLDEILWPN